MLIHVPSGFHLPTEKFSGKEIPMNRVKRFMLSLCAFALLISGTGFFAAQSAMAAKTEPIVEVCIYYADRPCGTGKYYWCPSPGQPASCNGCFCA